ncbi:MAG: potassium channel family protein [Anaerolineae bacterium]
MKSKHVVVVGCGRLGSTLANDLSSDGHRVIVIDQHPSAFNKLSVAFSGFKVVGDAVETQTLEQAQIKRANYLFAVTTADNINLMVAQVAQMIYCIPNVIARVYDPKREKLYASFGIKTISPTQLTVRKFYDVTTLHKDL